MEKFKTVETENLTAVLTHKGETVMLKHISLYKENDLIVLEAEDKELGIKVRVCANTDKLLEDIYPEEFKNNNNNNEE